MVQDSYRICSQRPTWPKTGKESAPRSSKRAHHASELAHHVSGHVFIVVHVCVSMYTQASAFTHASCVDCCMRNHFAHVFFPGVIGHVCVEHRRHAVICIRLLSRRHWSRMCRTHTSCSKKTFCTRHAIAQETAEF